jgi:hypothetical protein
MPRGVPSGLPVEYVRRDFYPIAGDSRRRYVNLHTGDTISRSSYQQYLARLYGFKDANDYYSFSRKFNGGLGGLESLSPRDVSRTKRLVEDYENKNGIPHDGSVLFQNPRMMNMAKGFLEADTGLQKKRWLNVFLDALGVRNYTPKWLPGETL